MGLSLHCMGNLSPIKLPLENFDLLHIKSLGLRSLLTGQLTGVLTVEMHDYPSPLQKILVVHLLSSAWNALLFWFSVYLLLLKPKAVAKNRVRAPTFKS